MLQSDGLASGRADPTAARGRRSRLLVLVFAASLALSVGVLSAATWWLVDRWDHAKPDGFFKHDDPARLLAVAMSVPMPSGYGIVSRTSSRGVADNNSDAEVSYRAPRQEQACVAALPLLRAKGWRPSAFGEQYVLSLPHGVSAHGVANPQIEITCLGSSLTVDVAGA